MNFVNCYQDETRASAYATLEFKNTYHLAYRDLPVLLRKHVRGTKAADFGCGAGRSTRFVRELGYEVVGLDIAEDMIQKARELDPAGDYRLIPGDDLSGLPKGAFDLVMCVFTFDNIAAIDKPRILGELRELLRAGGTMALVVSRPEIYTPRMGVVLNPGLPTEPAGSLRGAGANRRYGSRRPATG
jgi:SAM-dependent methyltransferase